MPRSSDRLIRVAQSARNDEEGFVLRVEAEPLVAPPRSAGVPHHGRRSWSQWSAGGILSILAFIGLFPFLYMFVASFKSTGQFLNSYWQPTWPLHLSNYTSAWGQVYPYFVSTAIVAGAAIVGTLLLATSAGFVFARYEFIGRKVLFGLLAALLMIPSIASLIPLFVMMRNFGLLNTRLVLILPQITGTVVLGTLLIKTHTEGISQELFDAAQIDGASGPRLFRSIMLPLAKPMIGTIILIQVISVWNDFFWPLLTISQNNLWTIPVGLSFFTGQNTLDFGPLFAGYTLASLPLLLVFILLSKNFLAGTHGGFGVGEK